jgi:hypothetical protein
MQLIPLSAVFGAHVADFCGYAGNLAIDRDAVPA